jgi:hypothetical protein
MVSLPDRGAGCVAIGRRKEPAMFIVGVIVTLLVVLGSYRLLRRPAAH